MAYSDLTDTFRNNKRLDWQDFDALAENDAFLKTNWSKYRRPCIRRVTSSVDSAHYIEVCPNGGDANTTKILFPDGDLRTVTEDRSTIFSSIQQYTSGRPDTENARLTSPHNSGNGAGLSMSTNQTNGWNFVYAVKTTDDATKFVLVMVRNIPTRAGISALNNAFGVNGWVYLGAYRVGDIQDSSTLILPFKQVGNMTILTHGNNGNASDNAAGFVIATGTSSPVSYSYVAGFNSTNIPDNFGLVLFSANTDAGSSNFIRVTDSGGNIEFVAGDIHTSRGFCEQFLIPPALGVRVNQNSGNRDSDILVLGWIDSALGVGHNPVI